MYIPKHTSSSEFIPMRELRAHVRTWGRKEAPLLVMLHGWMDVSASFQFLVDCLRKDWFVVALDWRGYGLTQLATPGQSKADTYWFADYLADLDALLDHYSPNAPVDMVAHSLGGNVACIYAGVRPQRIRALVNLEGYGMPEMPSSLAPRRYAKWLDQVRAGARLRDYAKLEEVAEKLRENNPRLPFDKALFLAQHWSVQSIGDDGRTRFSLAADPAHKLVNPTLYRVDEVVACWKQITAKVLLVDSDTPDDWAKFTREPAFAERLKAIPNLERALIAQAGHMLHHDQPEKLAHIVEQFLA
jgi:pimeloyl-ACP methyl ester carboxylesterase